MIIWAHRRTSKYFPRSILIQTSSHIASTLIPSGLDFVYIDSNHRYDFVTQDINLWWGKIISGGILGGHDYYERHDSDTTCEVMSAVNDFAAMNSLSLICCECSSWFIIKP